jgi:hypothetical protein
VGTLSSLKEFPLFPCQCSWMDIMQMEFGRGRKMD